jgi:hypothetical protein
MANHERMQRGRAVVLIKEDGTDAFKNISEMRKRIRTKAAIKSLLLTCFVTGRCKGGF